MKMSFLKLPMALMLIATILFVSCEKENFDSTTVIEGETEVEVELVSTATECDNSFSVEGEIVTYSSAAAAFKYDPEDLYLVHSTDYDFFGAETAEQKFFAATDGLPGVAFKKSESIEVGDVLAIADLPLLQDWDSDWKLYEFTGNVTITQAGNEAGESLGGLIEAVVTDRNGNISVTTGSFCAEIVE